MAKTLRDLAKRLDDLVETGLSDTLKERKARVGNAIVRALVPATPVDTSKAVSNWRVSTTGAISAYIRAHFPGVAGSTRGASAAAAIAAAEAAISRAQPQQALVIFNSVPYIRRLNEGYSKQTPAGFVEKAVLVGRIAARAK